MPGPTRPGLSRSGKTHNIFCTFSERVSIAKHCKLVGDSSEFHLTLNRAFVFQLEIRKKKRDILSEKRESGMALKSASLRPKAVMLTRMR